MNFTTNNYITYFNCVNELQAIETNQNTQISEMEQEDSQTRENKNNLFSLSRI